MSRYYLLGAQEAVVGGMRRRLKAGTTIADTAANSQFGDLVAPGLCANPNNRLVPLDSAAVTAMQAVGFANAAVGQPLSAQSTGADSIDG
jgi:hypothetical protein